MTIDLVLMPSIHGMPNKPFVLTLRNYGPAGTDHNNIGFVDRELADNIIKAGACFWLYGPPKEGVKWNYYEDAINAIVKFVSNLPKDCDYETCIQNYLNQATYSTSWHHALLMIGRAVAKSKDK